ncbi:MAG: glycosyltransferase family 39 protein [Chloroflexi bacterium]|nr:glycosyltransferase family 39 protein [Chloroflexota bacterium]
MPIKRPFSPELIDRTLSNLASGFFRGRRRNRRHPRPARPLPGNHAHLRFRPCSHPSARPHPGKLAHHPAFPTAAHPVTDHRPRPSGLLAASTSGCWSGRRRWRRRWPSGRPLPLLAAALTVWPAYLLGKRLLPLPAAKLGTGLTAALPSLLLFAPKSVQLYAPLTLFLLWAFHIALERWSGRWFVIAGLLYGVATFLSLGNFSLALLLLVYALLAIWQQHAWQQVGWRRIVAGGLLFGAAGLSLWLVYWLIWGAAPWRIWQTGLAQHYTLVTPAPPL